jgi:iron complex transport system ATP-binding protein
MTNLELRDLSFSYRDRSALRGVSLTVRSGELVCLLGPNGAGKSTLFKCALSLLRGYRGSALIGGTESRDLPAAELSRRIAYIPQAHQGAFDYTALEIVLMGAAGGRNLFAVPRRADEERARSRLEDLGIAHLADRGYERISGGERQLVLIARALAQEAPILVMDEPTANLDYGNQVLVMERVAELARRGYAVLLSTHNPEHAFLWATRAAVLVGGELIGDGAPGELLTEPMLERVYGVKVGLFRLEGGMGHRACVPHAALRR